MAARRVHKIAPMKRALPLIAFLTAAGAFAQYVSIGSAAGIEANSSLGATTIDMSHPASATGQVTTAWIRWTGPTTCTASMRLKVLRLDVVSGNFTVVADRPLTVSAGANKVLLGIPISVQAGDLIATVADGTCGSVAATRARYGDFSLVTSGDIVSGRTITSFNMNRDTRPLVQLTNSDPLLSGVIPAVGFKIVPNAGSFSPKPVRSRTPNGPYAGPGKVRITLSGICTATSRAS